MTSARDEEHDLCVRIGRAVHAQAPPGWIEAVVRREQIGSFHRTTVIYRLAGGGESTTALDGLEEAFTRLREVNYTPGHGTWFLCRLDYGLASPSYNSQLVTFMVDEPFDLTDIPAAAFVDELRTFPRDPASTPPWLASRIPPGTTHPAHPPRPPLPAEPDTGHDRWPPLAQMVARLVATQIVDGTFTLGLAEDPDGAGTALIFMACADEPDEQDVDLGMDTYCIVHEMHHATFYGGLTHCELVGNRLTLRFTTQAAHQLDVVPELPIDLDVDADAVARLGAGLRRILRTGRPDEHPQLVGI